MRIAIFYSDKTSMQHMIACLEDFRRQFPELIDRHIVAPLHHLRRRLARETFDMIVLACKQASRRLLALASWLKNSHEQPPYTLLTLDESDREATLGALRVGIDDFLTTAPSSDQFRLRMLRFLCRRQPCTADSQAPSAAPGNLRYGNLSIDVAASQAYCDGHAVALTRQELLLAELFLRNVGQQISRALIYENVWGREEHPLSRSLDVHIYRLRKKLQLVKEHGWSLDSVYGFGYQLRRLEHNEAHRRMPAARTTQP